MVLISPAQRCSLVRSMIGPGPSFSVTQTSCRLTPAMPMRRDLMNIPIDQIVVGPFGFHANMAEGHGVGRRIVGFFVEKALTDLFFGLRWRSLAGIPAHLPFDAILVVHRNESARRSLIAARRHGVQGHNKLINPPQVLAAAEGTLRAVGETGIAVENFNIFRGFFDAEFVGGPLLRRLLSIHFVVVEIVGRVQPHDMGRIDAAFENL